MLARGIRFRRTADNQGVLLIPEGVVNLNASAAAIVELIDGKRSSAEIVSDLCSRFEVSERNMQEDVEALMRRFASRAWLDLVTADDG